MHFCCYIQAYTNVFAFASHGFNLEHKLDDGYQDAYIFRVSGDIYIYVYITKFDQFKPPQDQEKPRSAQMYIYEPEMQLHYTLYSDTSKSRLFFFSDLNRVSQDGLRSEASKTACQHNKSKVKS